MRAVDLIAAKRDGRALTRSEIDWFIGGYVDGTIADYQAAAWLMAVYLRGMTLAETVDLTLAMAASGGTLDLGPLAPRCVDKHSTGGVGDKVSLVAGPIASAVGVIVPKMSGRGLGLTGGTLDKLESIPGFRVDLDEAQIRRQAAEVGLVIAGQTARLAPADGKLYALRDVTATVASQPLIVSSILSKKLAGGAPSIMLDVKAGRGAFMPTVAEAVELANGLVRVGTACGRRVVAYVTRMDQPLGRAVGNAVEVREAIGVLRGGGPSDVRELALTLAAEMVGLAGLVEPGHDARPLVERALTSGAALARLRAMVDAQGGDVAVLDDPTKLPTAPRVDPVCATRSGYIARLDAGAVGQAVLALGAGRERKGEPVDHRVGVIFHRKVGDFVALGDPLFDLHLGHSNQLGAATKAILGAIDLADTPIEVAPLIVRRITAEDDGA